MLKILKDVYHFRNIKWRFECNNNWLIREYDNVNKEYFFDITYISESLFNAIKNFEVVSYKEKTIKKLNFLQKLCLVIALRRVLNDIKILVITPNVVKLTKEEKKSNLSLNIPRADETYISGTTIYNPYIEIEGHNVMTQDDFQDNEGCYTIYKYNELTFKIKERAKRIFQESISFDEILRKINMK